MAFILDANSEEKLGPIYIYEYLHHLLIHKCLQLLFWLVLVQSGRTNNNYELKTRL